MIDNILIATTLLPAISLIILGSYLALGKNENSGAAYKFLKAVLLFSIPAAVVAMVTVFNQSFIQSNFIGVFDLGIQFRLDTLNLLMYCVVSIIALVVLKFSGNYMSGDPRKNVFLGRLSITVALVFLFLLSNNLLIMLLAWVSISLSLHKLLVFYPERVKAQLAAGKKFIVARIGDVTLISAFILIYTEFNTGNISEILMSLNSGAQASIGLEVAMVLLVLTAVLKSAQLPFHGWLIDVMESPTPISALLHAGLLNAGPFLIIRFSPLFNVSSLAPVLLTIIGASTAIFGSIVFSKQTAIKTSLAYSSVAHMGFTLMLSGFGLYSASMLHLVAHSFYKAHAFLSSGTAIEQSRLNVVNTGKRNYDPFVISIGFVVTLFLFWMVQSLWSSFGAEEASHYTILGIIVFLGILNLLVNTIDSKVSPLLLLRVTALSVLTLLVFFGLEFSMRTFLTEQVPVLETASQAKQWLTIIVALVSFTVLLMSSLLKRSASNQSQRLQVHIKNGFYLNMIFDRIALNKLHPIKAKSSTKHQN
ncbi:NADH/ubiquinone/plastoquinone (complex i) [bacterium]|nr:NADH/ubiquinone/plastoquinone (complex i) [bacterium]